LVPQSGLWVLVFSGLVGAAIYVSSHSGAFGFFRDLDNVFKLLSTEAEDRAVSFP
jgi:hypothetical protein